MLAAGIAHDLNNVLAPIVFAAPMLRERISDSGDLKILDMLERSASRGAGLVKQILGFAHSNTAEFRPTQVKHLVRDVVSVLEQTLPKSIRIEHHIPSDLWVTLGNPTQIHQVLLNLCVNARDAMPRGGTLRVSAANRQLDAEQAAALPGARAGSWVVIDIADTGTGIPEDVLPHIWDPFFTTKGPDRGTGLGLSTVRGIVATHQGFMTLETRPGLGSTFSAYFPATAETSAVGVRTPNSAAPNGNRELILVVDDDMTICRMVATMLTRHNYSILTAGNGVEAVDVFNAHWRDIALVITDIDMPHLGGAGLARILVAKRPDLRLLIISGLGQSKSAGADFDEASKLARGVLPKPFTQETLLKTVHEMLNSGPKT
jgi:CheY-like chemotaxis protein